MHDSIDRGSYISAAGKAELLTYAILNARDRLPREFTDERTGMKMRIENEKLYWAHGGKEFAIHIGANPLQMHTLWVGDAKMDFQDMDNKTLLGAEKELRAVSQSVDWETKRKEREARTKLVKDHDTVRSALYGTVKQAE